MKEQAGQDEKYWSMVAVLSLFGTRESRPCCRVPHTSSDAELTFDIILGISLSELFLRKFHHASNRVTVWRSYPCDHSSRGDFCFPFILHKLFLETVYRLSRDLEGVPLPHTLTRQLPLP